MNKIFTIVEVANKLNINSDYLEQYGNDKAKIDPRFASNLPNKGKIVLVTAITPTKAGEGKTTMSIALADGLNRIGEQALLCLREPSLGPVFGIKGGATGGGQAALYPAEDINLHFTGDMHALTSSINLIAAIIDNHIYRGNELNIDPKKITWHRALDMNDRALRDISVAIKKAHGIKRNESFQITVASELMAIMCLANDENDFLNRINKIIVAYTYDNKPILLKDLAVSHAVMKLMKRALKPNLVQTLEGNPVLVHGGPFANIAHGCNSLIATNLATKLSPIVVTEAGFAADLGAEKFFDIKSRIGDLSPALAVIVATIKALKLHGGVDEKHLDQTNVPALLEGTKNLAQHYENIQKYKVKPMIAINHFASDSKEEVAALIEWCKQKDYEVTFVDSFIKGSIGAVDFASKVKKLLEDDESEFQALYRLDQPIVDKINIIAQQIYRAKGIKLTKRALESIEKIEKLGYSSLPICIAKTPHSFSDDPKRLNTPKNFKITVRDAYLSAGAGFIVILTGKVLTMPGLPKIPAAVRMEESDY